MINLYAKRLTKIMFILSCCLFLSIMGITLLNIILRAFGDNLRGAIEISGNLGAASLGLCLPWVQEKNSHAYAGVFFSKLPLSCQKLINFFVLLLSFGLTLVFSIELYSLALFVHEGMEVVEGFDIPLALFIMALTLGVMGQSLIIALKIIQVIIKSYRVIKHFFSFEKSLTVFNKGR